MAVWGGNARLSRRLRRAVELQQKARPEQAAHLYIAILNDQPRLFEALHRLGVLRLEQGRNAEALEHIAAALSVNGDDAVAYADFGRVQLALGDREAALESFNRALARQPKFAEALKCRGDVLKALGRPAEALQSYDGALALEPKLAEALNGRGLALLALGRLEEALASYNRALALNPDLAEALHNRGDVQRDLGRPAEALTSYNRALAVRPHYTEALHNRGATLRDLRRPEEALTSYDRALALKPDSALIHCSRASVLADLGRGREALASYDKALALEPDYAIAHDNRGVMLTELGRLDEAIGAFERAITLAPRRARSYFNLAHVTKLSASDPHVEVMNDLVRDMRSLTPGDQIDLLFALAKALADAGLHEASFRRLSAGNALKRQQTRYDEAATLAAFERICGAFSGEMMRRKAGSGHPSALPVFIVGMPRSGTTLIEQVLASHPQVFGAGESDALVRAAEGVGGGSLPSPEAISVMSDDQWRQLGSGYVSRLTAGAPAAMRITNKTPEHFRILGVIHLALPNARIIHVGRNPLDTCLSCFSTLFAGDLPYTYDLAELGRHYRAYQALMAHWRGVIPNEVMLEVQYEDVVADFERQARRIVAHCGLEWDRRCLDFHLTERPVRTASAAQVRKPLYDSSVGRWRAYEPFLGPLTRALQT